ncbi:hypothetical protein Ddc_07663 [Ditylenchus destructor]|nr:hypothetical protein Ddc_07663 [Ditylenchus destructor]
MGRANRIMACKRAPENSIWGMRREKRNKSAMLTAKTLAFDRNSLRPEIPSSSPNERRNPRRDHSSPHSFVVFSIKGKNRKLFHISFLHTNHSSSKNKQQRPQIEGGASRRAAHAINQYSQLSTQSTAIQ